MSMSSEMNDRPVELSEIRGWAPQTFVDQHRDLVLYPPIITVLSCVFVSVG